MDGVLVIETDLEPDALRKRLAAWEPWAHRIEFSNGVSTTEFRRRAPFLEKALSKLQLIDQQLPLDRFAGDPVLDVGCNAGHNAIEMARRGARVTGIDNTPRHIEVSRFLADVAGVDAEFVEANAEEFRREGFALILHLGTLYHLPNPVRALESAYHSLRPGGTLAIATSIFDHPDDPNLCAFMHGVNNDPTNWWALSTSALGRILERLGFEPPTELSRSGPTRLGEHGSRATFLTRKP